MDIFEFRDKYAGIKSIAFIGNSNTILSYNNGKLIDSYDMVVRFNRAHNRGLENKIGKKTTVLVSNDLNYTDRSQPPSKTLQPECIVSFINPKPKLNIKPLREWFGCIPYVITLAPDLHNFGNSKRTRSLTMGTYSLYTFLRLFEPEKIFITGFTMFGRVSGGSEKYFEKKLNMHIGNFHDLDEEVKIFRQILKQFNSEVKLTDEVARLTDQKKFSKEKSIKSTSLIRKTFFLISRIFLKFGFYFRRLSEKNNTLYHNQEKNVVTPP